MKAPSPDVLRQGSGNMYVGNPAPAKAVAVAVGTKFHSWSWSEGSNAVDEMRARDDRRTLSALGFEDMRDANDCPIMFRKSLNVVHFSMTKVSEDDRPEAIIDQNRVFSMLAYEAPMIDGISCHIGVHPNWTAGIDSADHPAVEEAVKSVKRLSSMLTFAKDMGWIPTVTGDFNVRKDSKKPFLTIHDVLAHHNLQVKMAGIDGMAWDRRLKLVDWTLIPKSRTQSDHDHWTVADLKRR